MAACLNGLVQLGDIPLLKRLKLPLQDAMRLCVKAAWHGQLGALKWLLRQQQQKLPQPEALQVCQAAVRRDDHDMVQLLAAQQKPAKLQECIPIARPACLLELGAACHQDTRAGSRS